MRNLIFEKSLVLKRLMIFMAVFLVLFSINSIPAKTKIKSYYSGDALNYKGQLVVISTNSEALEVFVWQGAELEKRLSWRPVDKRFNREESFSSAVLNIENNRLYVYAVSGYTLYKYDISSLNSYSLLAKDTNTYWEWYNQVDKFTDKIITVSEKGLKVFNYDLNLIASYDLKNEIPSHISSAGSRDFIFNLKEKEEKIEVLDYQSGKLSKNLLINFWGRPDIRSLYFDPYNDHLFYADDRAVKKINLDGILLDSFEHVGYPGYDVQSSGNNYLYFANGLGVVKLRKSDLSLISSQRTGSLVAEGGWAMGLKVLPDYQGEKIVLFNNSAIIIMDDNLRPLASVLAGPDERVYAQENLFLKLNSPSFKSGEEIELQGGGYLPGENLKIEFYKQNYELKADNDGRFKKILRAPNLSESCSDSKVYLQEERGGSLIRKIQDRPEIKVLGEKSLFTYSISFELEELVIIKN